jgi:hypothetical protein
VTPSGAWTARTPSCAPPERKTPSRRSPSADRLPVLTDADRLHAALEDAFSATTRHQGNCA